MCKDKDLKFVLKQSLRTRTRTRTNIPGQCIAYVNYGHGEKRKYLKEKYCLNELWNYFT